jgi:hypothetical protein
MEVKNNLALIPDVIRCRQSRCRNFYFSGDGIRQILGKMFLGLCAMEGFGVSQCITLFFD